MFRDGDVKHKSKKQQKLCSILRNPRFREQFIMLDNPYKFWEGMSNYLSSNILIIDKLFNEYMKDELKKLNEKIANLEDKIKLMESVSGMYRDGQILRDMKIVMMWDDGINMKKISNEIGITRQGVSKVLRRLGQI